MNPTLRQMRGFAAVAEHGSFTQAGRALHLTQSAVSVLIRELEHELGVQLLDRSTRRVQLTEAGREFLAASRRILDTLGEAVANVRDLREQRRGTLRVAAPQLMSCTVIPQAIARYARQHPNIDVRLADSLPEQVLDRVLTGEAEIGIGPALEVDDALDRSPLLSDGHLLVCRPDHPLAARRRLTWAHLRDQPFIAPTRDFLPALAASLAGAGKPMTLRPVHEVSYITSAIALVQAGRGLTACPSYAASIVGGFGLAMRPIGEPTFVREVSVFTRRGASLSPAAAGFVEVLRSLGRIRATAAR